MIGLRGNVSAPRDDAVYSKIESSLAALGARRDSIAAQVRSMLDGAAFGGQAFKVHVAISLIHRAASLLAGAAALGH